MMPVASVVASVASGSVAIVPAERTLPVMVDLGDPPAPKGPPPRPPPPGRPGMLTMLGTPGGGRLGVATQGPPGGSIGGGRGGAPAPAAQGSHWDTKLLYSAEWAEIQAPKSSFQALQAADSVGGGCDGSWQGAAVSSGGGVGA